MRDYESDGLVAGVQAYASEPLVDIDIARGGFNRHFGPPLATQIRPVKCARA